MLQELHHPSEGDSTKTLIVAESEVYAVRDGKEKLVAKATVTLAPVGKGK